ncbi:Uncharacterised protein [uncultured archaeon]|nr:Uncharacterised protein [uncultured archaeon]
MEEAAVVEPKRIKIIPIFLMHLVLGLGISALGTFTDNTKERIGGILFALAAGALLFIVPGYFPPCVTIYGVSTGGCAERGLINIAVIVLGAGSYVYIFARLYLLSKDPNAKLVAF